MGRLKPALRRLEAAAGAVAGPGADAIFLAHVGHDLDVDLAEPLVRIRLRIVGDSVAVAQVFAYALECFHLLLPGFGEENLATGPGGDAPEDVARYRVLAHVAGG